MSDHLSVETIISVHLSGDAEALALAQLVKRLSWSDCRALATSDEEAYRMMDALSDKGISPRLSATGAGQKISGPHR